MSAHGWYIYGSRHEAGAPDTVLLAHDGPTRPEHHDQLRALLAALSRTDNRFPHARTVIDRAQRRIPHLAGALVRQDVEALVELAREQADELDRIGRARLALAAVRLIATESVTEDAGLLRRAILDQLPAGVAAEAAEGYETDPEPDPELGEHGTCAAPVGRGAEGTGVCGHEIALREERTTPMADGTDGHGQPGGRLVRVWRHTDVALDYMHRAQAGGPA